MKKIVLTVLSVLAINVINAQEVDSKSKTEYTKNRAESVEMRAQKDVETLNTNLSLNEEQKKKAHDFSVAKITKITDIRAKYSNTTDNNSEQRKKEFDVVMEEYKSNIKSILTPTQVEKFNAMK